MTSFNQLTPNGTAHHLVQHLGNPDTTLVAGEHYLSLVPTRDMTGVRYPDLLVAFGVDPAAYYRSNAYVISEQGKPPDFVLEIVSRSSRQADRVDKREDYAALGIPEYWRFDEAARRRENRLAGDRLVDGVYEPIAIEELEDGVLQGYSTELNLYLRWEQGPTAAARPGDWPPYPDLRRPARPSRLRTCPRRKSGGPHPRAGSGKPAAARRVNTP